MFVSCLVAVGACGAAAPVSRGAPDTAADPLPYTPPAESEASAGAAAGLIAVDNGNVAIDVVRGFFEAAATGTAAEMEAFLSDAVTTRMASGPRRSVPARRLSQQFIRLRQTQGPLGVEALVDVNALELTAINPQLPLEPDDRAVRVPIASQGSELLAAFLGWTGASGVVYVRPRTRRIIGF